ncbi:hypothetical protein HMI55_004719 [Coelomomyces lativittatus]|nr:hypothetical protein HMI55_004719 [Coelomomyces lativittatus]
MMNKQDPKKIHLVIPNSSLESGNAEQFLERPRRPSADDIFHFISKSSKTKNHQSILDLESLGIHPHKITNTNPFSITPIESSRRKWSFSTSSAKKPEMTPQSPTILSAEDRITPRDLGFLNETSRLKRPSMTVEDWIRFHCDEPIVTLFSPTSSSPQDTQPKNTEVGSGLRRRLSKSSTFESHLNSPLPIIYLPRSCSPKKMD